MFAWWTTTPPPGELTRPWDQGVMITDGPDGKYKEMNCLQYTEQLNVTGFTKTVLNRTFGNSRNTKLKY